MTMTTTTTTQRKSVVVTGGASGIGLGITHYFASQPTPHHISILDITPSGASLATSLATEYPTTTFSFHTCDISNWPSIAAAFASIHATQGRIDTVMANAGISREPPLILDEPVPTQPLLKTLDVNLTGAIYTIKLAIHYMRKNPLPPSPSPPPSSQFSSPSSPPSRGTIIATASNAGIYAFPVAPIYAASKAGVINLVRSLARPLSAHGIAIHALAPAVLETNIAPSRDLFRGMLLTPMETLVRAVDLLVGGGMADNEGEGKEEGGGGGVKGSWEGSGRIAEVHGAEVTVVEAPEYVDGDSGKNIEHFWSLGYA